MNAASRANPAVAMNAPAPPSSAAVALGHLAVAPFVAGAALAVGLQGEPQGLALRALVAYAAAVASFVGAIHWGFGFVRPEPRVGLFAWGVVPALVAWGSLLVAPPVGLAVDAGLLLVCLLVDRAVYPAQGAARWLPLRLRLTVLAAAAARSAPGPAEPGCMIGRCAASTSAPGRPFSRRCSASSSSRSSPSASGCW